MSLLKFNIFLNLNFEFKIYRSRSSIIQLELSKHRVEDLF